MFQVVVVVVGVGREGAWHRLEGEGVEGEECRVSRKVSQLSRINSHLNNSSSNSHPLLTACRQFRDYSHKVRMGLNFGTQIYSSLSGHPWVQSLSQSVLISTVDP